MKLIRSLLLLTLVVSVLSCKKAITKEEPEPLSSEKELISFAIPDSLNTAYIKETIAGEINGSEINLSLPGEVNASKLVATFGFKGAGVFIGAVQQTSGVTVNDFTKDIVYTVKAEDGSTKDYTIKITLVYELKSVIPHIYIDTDEKAPVNSKDNYVNANLRIDGAGEYEDYEGRTRIKGRGNSTWSYPKKPYRLKLDSKAPLFGLSTEKDWILLANYLDESLMCNAIAMKAGRLLEMPYTHHIIPVDVTLNGEYIGSYMFTEQKEVDDNRINIADGGVWLELDTYFDEPFKFYSKDYQLPVMVQYPELEDWDPAEANAELAKIKSDFELFTAAVKDASFPNNNYSSYFDLDAFVNYMIVYTLTLNEEINHPKSTYIYKPKDGKYNMGPIWDFDWAFGYEGRYTHFVEPTRDLFWSGTSKGTVFFSRLMHDPAVKSLFKQKWNQFRASEYPKLISYMERYADILKDSYARDYARWKRSSSPDISIVQQKMMDWLNARATYMDGLTSGW